MVYLALDMVVRITYAIWYTPHRKGESMQTAAERLDFLIRFVNMDLAQLRPGDWLNLRDDFAAFLGYQKANELVIVGPMYTDHVVPSPVDYTNKDFQALQEETRAVLRRLTAIQNATVYSEHPYAVCLAANSVTFTRVGLAVPTVSKAHKLPRRTAKLYLDGPLRDIFLMLTTCLFAFESTAGVTQCPECERFLLRSKKRQYCSARCQSRAYMRRFRQREAVKERESEKAHARYAKRVKQQVGEKVQVVRRPRQKGGKTR